MFYDDGENSAMPAHIVRTHQTWAPPSYDIQAAGRDAPATIRSRVGHARLQRIPTPPEADMRALSAHAAATHFAKLNAGDALMLVCNF